MARSIIFQGKPTGTVYIRSDLAAMNDRLKSYAVIIVVVFLASLVVALLISRLSQRVISEPVMQLAQTVRIVSHEKNYSIRAATNPNRDEVSTLIESVNEMLERFSSAMAPCNGPTVNWSNEFGNALPSWLWLTRNWISVTAKSSAQPR